MWWVTLASTLLGASIALAGGWLTTWLPLRERRAERRAEALSRRGAFERETLQELLALLPRVMRDAALVHFADVDAAKREGVYAGHLLPEGLTPDNLEHGRQFTRHSALLLDDDLRTQANAFWMALNGQSAPGPRSLAEGEAAFSSLMRQYDILNEHLAARLRALWRDVGETGQL